MLQYLFSLRIVSAASSPSMPGMEISSSAIWHFLFLNISIASRPLTACHSSISSPKWILYRFADYHSFNGFVIRNQNTTSFILQNTFPLSSGILMLTMVPTPDLLCIRIDPFHAHHIKPFVNIEKTNIGLPVIFLHPLPQSLQFSVSIPTPSSATAIQILPRRSGRPDADTASLSSFRSQSVYNGIFHQRLET